MEVASPRSRNGEFEPQIIGKHQRERSGFDNKILSMYGLGLSTQGIRKHIKDSTTSRYPPSGLHPVRHTQLSNFI